MISRLFHVIREGFLQFWRTRGLSVAVVVIVGATLLQLSFFLGISLVLDRALGSAREKFEMAVFLSPAARDMDRKRVQDLLLADSRVASVRLVTKEEALLEFRKDPEIDRMLQALDENPLTDSFTVILRQDAMDNPEDLAAKLKEDPQVTEVDYGKNEWETVSRLSRLTRWLGLGLGGIIFLTALFIVSSTLTLALWARRENLILMSRMGAPAWMLWGPYLWEGILQGFLGALLVAVFLEAVRRGLGAGFQKYGSLDVLVNLPAPSWGRLYLMLVVLGVVLGFFGAALALRKKWVREIH